MANSKSKTTPKAKVLKKTEKKIGKTLNKDQIKFKKIDLEKLKGKEEKKNVKKGFNGVVVADTMDKTITVEISAIKVHPLYKKRYKRNKKFKVHDPKNQFKKGDEVRFVPSKPYSKHKKWHVIYK